MSSAAGMQMTPAAAEARGIPTQAAVMQTIAHELRQPLSAIESIAYYLNLVLPRDDRRAREQASRLQNLVEQSNWILTCGLQLVNEIPLAPEPVDLQELITQCVALRAAQRDSHIELRLADSLPLVVLDPGRGRALIDNLLNLFECAAGVHPVELSTESGDQGVCLTLTTAAPGYPGASALGHGCALSIACARRTVERHGGIFDLDVDPTRGIVLKVVLP